MKKVVAVLVLVLVFASVALAADTLNVQSFKALGKTSVLENGWGLKLKAGVGGNFVVGTDFQCIQTAKNPKGYLPGQSFSLKRGDEATAWCAQQQ
jgi:opacity protein-like surface antigen